MVGSQALRTVLDRRVETRRNELLNLTRNTSVIVSNPSTSTPDPSAIEDPSNFFGSKNNSVIEKVSNSIPKIKVVPPPFEIYQDPVDSQPHQMPVIQTPLSVSVGQENIHPDFLDLNQEVEIQSNMDFGYGEDVSPGLIEKFKMIKSTSSKVRALTEMYDPGMYSASILKRNESTWLKSVEDAFAQVMAVVIDIDDICTDSEADQNVKKDVDEALPVLKKSVQKFLVAYNNKVMTLQSDVDREVVPSISRAGSNASSQGSARAAQVTVDIDKEKLTADIKALNNELKRVDDWTKADAAEVEFAMSQIQHWKKMFKSIQDTFYNIKRVSLSNYLDSSQFAASEAAVKNIETELEMIIQDVEYEDEHRALYSLCKSKSAEVKYPSFAGGIDEDFAKFKREMLAAFKSNKVKKSDQVKKLRENLKSQPRSMIADNLEDIDEAFSILDTLYGDPSRIMKAKKSKLLSLGSFPKPGSKAANHLKSQLDWLMQLELLLKDIFVLAEESSDAYCEFYSPSLYRTIKSYFPYSLCKEMANHSGSTKERMSQLCEFVIQTRKFTQDMMKDVDVDTGGASGSGAGQSRSAGAVSSQAQPLLTSLQSKFRNAVRNEKCKVCKELEANGDTDNLYEDHFGTTPYGCPRFAALGTAERKQMVFKLRCCKFCLDTDYVHRRPTDRHKNCPAFAKTQTYNCEKCKIHYLICDRLYVFSP